MANKEYSSESDIDTLIVSEHLFTHYVMRSLEWVKNITKPNFSKTPPESWQDQDILWRLNDGEIDEIGKGIFESISCIEVVNGSDESAQASSTSASSTAAFVTGIILSASAIVFSLLTL